jgi:hypothetical protein
MTVTKAIAGIALFAAFFAPAAQAGNVEQAWLPRAMPSDYAAVANALPRAMPADYGRAGVTLIESVGMPQAIPSDYRTADYGIPRAMPADYGRYLVSVEPPAPSNRFDWTAVAIGAGTAALLVVLLAGLRVRRAARVRTA